MSISAKQMTAKYFGLKDLLDQLNKWARSATLDDNIFNRFRKELASNKKGFTVELVDFVCRKLVPRSNTIVVPPLDTLFLYPPGKHEVSKHKVRGDLIEKLARRLKSHARSILIVLQQAGPNHYLVVDVDHHTQTVHVYDTRKKPAQYDPLILRISILLSHLSPRPVTWRMFLSKTANPKVPDHINVSKPFEPQKGMRCGGNVLALADALVQTSFETSVTDLLNFPSSFIPIPTRALLQGTRDLQRLAAFQALRPDFRPLAPLGNHNLCKCSRRRREEETKAALDSEQHTNMEQPDRNDVVEIIDDRSDIVKMADNNGDIYFNSKSKEPFNYLSNFYGDVEFHYMKIRFPQQKMQALLEDMRTCSKEKFIYYLKVLQPGKKDWTPRKENFWLSNGKPIRGILFKLVGGIHKKTATFKRRRRVLQELTGLSSITMNAAMGHNQSIAVMRTLLQHKFSSEPFRTILQSTGNKRLHEKPMRGKSTTWTLRVGDRRGPENDALGKLLEEIRAEQRE